jgi:hypothetical protein
MHTELNRMRILYVEIIYVYGKTHVMIVYQKDRHWVYHKLYEGTWIIKRRFITLGEL